MKALSICAVFLAFLSGKGVHAWYQPFQWYLWTSENEPDRLNPHLAPSNTLPPKYSDFGQEIGGTKIATPDKYSEDVNDDDDDVENNEEQDKNVGNVTQTNEGILKYHNEYRRKCAQGEVFGQPATTKIGDLKWSTELERSAQRHANRCQFRHDSQTDRATAQWSWVGQNIAYSSSVEQNVKMWFEEHKQYNYGANSCSGVCGHYTQMVWADTTHVGCGVSKCNFSGFNAEFVVCNYGPGGNFNGRRPY